MEQTKFHWHTFNFIFRDVCVQFVLDNLIKIAVRVEGGLAVIQTHLMDAYKVLSAWDVSTDVYTTYLLETLLKNWFMISVRLSSYGCTREVWRARA